MNFTTIKNGNLEITIDELDKTFVIFDKVTSDIMLDAIEEAGINPTLTCSSSLDHPDEYTDNEDVILMCDLIRGNNVSGKNPNFENGEKE